MLPTQEPSYAVRFGRHGIPLPARLALLLQHWLKVQSGHHPKTPIWKDLAAADCPLLPTADTCVPFLPPHLQVERWALGSPDSQAAKGPESTICGEMTIIKVFLFTYQLLL